MCFNSNLYGFEQNGDRMLLNLSGLPTDSEPAGESTSQAGEGGKAVGRWDAGAAAAHQRPPAMVRCLCCATGLTCEHVQL